MKSSLLFGCVTIAAAFGPLPGIHAQGPVAPVAPKQKFEVASIRRCASGVAARGGRGSGGGEGGPGAWSPGRITVRCVPTMTLLQDAYIRYPDGKTEPGFSFALKMAPIQGAPAWVSSDLYTVEAKAEGKPNKPAMFGPMLQSLLEDRFGLKIHYETKIVPSWDLTVAKGRSKLKPTTDDTGKCVLDLPPGMNSKGADGLPFPGFTPDGHFNIPPRPAGQPCHILMTLMHGPNGLLIGKAITLEELSAYLVRATGRPVIDKTGLTGKFDVVLEYAPDETTAEPSAVSSPGASSDVPTMVTAVEEQLGLKLVPAKGPREFVVIDHIAKPSEN